MTPIPHTHLRAGNIVQGIPIALGFLKDEPFEIFPLSAQDIGILEMGRHKVYPVELTAEVLERCGFIYDPITDTHHILYMNGYRGFTLYKSSLILPDGSVDVDYWWKDSALKAHHFAILDLHRLQNLFHALTGEELTYTVT